MLCPFIFMIRNKRVMQRGSLATTVRSDRSFTRVKLEYLEKDNEFFDAVFLNDRREYSAFSGK